VPYAYRKHFNPESVTQLITTFKHYDKDGNSKMDKTEFKAALKDMGEDNVTDEQVGALLSKFDQDNSGFIEWVEFLDMMQTIKVRGKKSGLGIEELKIAGQEAHAQVGAGGAKSIYLDEEVSSFARVINKELKDVED
jgi:anthranilate phosphoribosyltransferase